jgi:hypothetical protein
MCTNTREASKVRATHPSYKIPAALRDAGNISHLRPPFRRSRHSKYFEWIKTLLIGGNSGYPEHHGGDVRLLLATTPPAWACGTRAIPQGGL